jgi:hypothetical protein
LQTQRSKKYEKKGRKVTERCAKARGRWTVCVSGKLMPVPPGGDEGGVKEMKVRDEQKV